MFYGKTNKKTCFYWNQNNEFALRWYHKKKLACSFCQSKKFAYWCHPNQNRVCCCYQSDDYVVTESDKTVVIKTKNFFLTFIKTHKTWFATVIKTKNLLDYCYQRTELACCCYQNKEGYFYQNKYFVATGIETMMPPLKQRTFVLLLSSQRTCLSLLSKQRTIKQVYTHLSKH